MNILLETFRTESILVHRMIEETSVLQTSRRLSGNFSEDVAEELFNNISSIFTNASSVANFETELILRNFTTDRKHYSHYPRLLSELETTIFWLVFPAVTVVGLLGNALVILAILGNQSMRRSLMNLLLVNLAFADFGNLAASIVDWLQILITRSPWWWLGSELCPVVKYSEVLFLYVSVFFQVAVSIERFIAIIFPLKVSLYCNRQSIYRWTVLIWTLGAILAIPLYAIYPQTLPVGLFAVVQCTKPRTDPPMYTYLKIAEFIIFYFLPLILFILLYTKISIVLWHSTRYFHESVRKIGSRKAAAMRIETRRGVVKMLVWCISIYFLSFSPIQVFFLYRLLTKKPFVPSYVWFLAASGLCYASSACNPILYTIFSERFRIRFGQILTCKNVFGGPPEPRCLAFQVSRLNTMHTMKKRYSEQNILLPPGLDEIARGATSKDSLLDPKDSPDLLMTQLRKYSRDDLELTHVNMFPHSETMETSYYSRRKSSKLESVEETAEENDID